MSHDQIVRVERSEPNSSAPSNSNTDAVITDNAPPNSQTIPGAANMDPEPKCIEPSAVCLALKTERIRALHTSCTESANTRSTLCCSESEEEIDVERAQPQQNHKSKVARPYLTSTKKGKYSKKKQLKSHESARYALHYAKKKTREKKRRNNLRNSFNILRMIIPDLEKKKESIKSCYTG